MNKKLLLSLLCLSAISINSFAMLGQARQWLSKNFGSRTPQPSKSQTASSFESYLGSEQEFGGVSPEEALTQVKADAIDNERKKIDSTINNYRARIAHIKNQPGLYDYPSFEWASSEKVMGYAMYLNEIINEHANIIKSLPEYEQKKVAQLIDTMLESEKELFDRTNKKNNATALIDKKIASEKELKRYGISLRAFPDEVGKKAGRTCGPRCERARKKYVSQNKREYEIVPSLTMITQDAPIQHGEPTVPEVRVVPRKETGYIKVKTPALVVKDKEVVVKENIMSIEKPAQSWLSSAWKTISSWFSK